MKAVCAFLFLRFLGEAHGVDCDHQLLVGGDHCDFDRGICCREHGVLEGLLRLAVIKLESHITEVLADVEDEPWVVFSDAGCEYDEVHAVHLCDESSDLFHDVVHELVDREFALGVALLCGFNHVTHVGTLTVESDESGLLVHDVRHLVGGESLFLHDVGDYVGIDGAAARSHDHALKRGESHGGVYALAILDCSHGTSVADVAGDDLAVVDVKTCELCTLSADIVVGRAVCAVSPYSVFLIILVGECVHVGGGFHGLVECRVEYHCLRHVGQDFLHGAYAENVGGVMQRGEVAANADFLHYALVDED